MYIYKYNVQSVHLFACSKWWRHNILWNLIQKLDFINFYNILIIYFILLQFYFIDKDKRNKAKIEMDTYFCYSCIIFFF